MNRNTRIALYKASQDPTKDNPAYQLKRDEALDLLRRGLAVECGNRAIQQVKVGREVVTSSYAVGSSSAADRHEALGREKYSQIFQGGLVRNRPNKPCQRFQGARVGHQ